MTIETANRLYELRKKHNLSQEELAEKLGVSRQAVSKWERSEASPDTDNLIALAKIYDLSLDELIYGEKRAEEPKEEATENTEPSSDEESAKEFEGGFINIKDSSGDKVKIGLSGIVVEESSGERVEIGWNGVKVNVNKSDDKVGGKVIIDNNGAVNINVSTKEKKKTKFWLELPYPIICTVLYLLFGFLDILGGWHPAWIIFVTIPIYYSLVEAIYKKKATVFNYAVLTVVIYLVLGCYFNNWHPSWLVFVTVPIYYPIASALDKKIHGEAYSEYDDDDEDDEDDE